MALIPPIKFSSILSPCSYVNTNQKWHKQEVLDSLRLLCYSWLYPEWDRNQIETTLKCHSSSLSPEISPPYFLLHSFIILLAYWSMIYIFSPIHHSYPRSHSHYWGCIISHRHIKSKLCVETHTWVTLLWMFFLHSLRSFIFLHGGSFWGLQSCEFFF